VSLPLQSKKDESEEPVEKDERDKDTPWFVWVPLLLATIAFTFLVYLLVFGDEVAWWQVLIGVGISYPIAIVTTQVCAGCVHSMGGNICSDALPLLRRFSAAPTGVFRPPSRSLVCRGNPNPPRVPCMSFHG
jgi:hypothetical protein